MATHAQVLDGYLKRQKVLEASYSSNPLARGVAWVEGELTPLHEARIPILDQGFLHSDLTYDVPAVWDGRLYRFDDHLDRLEASCKKLRLKSPLSREEIVATIKKMIAKSGIRDAYVELIVTRGQQFVRTMDPNDKKPNALYLMVMPYVWVMPLEMQNVGGSAVICRSTRRIPPGAIDPTIKNLQWGDLIRGLFEAQDRGSVYPFLTDGDANLTEGSGFNIWLVVDGILYTPARGVLEGITRRSVIEIANAKGIEVRYEVPVELAYRAQEIFTSTTAGGIMSIVELDGAPVGDGKVGPVTSLVWDEYWAMHYLPEHTLQIGYPA
ncbi:putative class IV aminotransferase [Colletotrichum plurivorum]|uniref:Putative class IV aminotransferase n=1 Tax=Colletotrichum plurivorum TaxID=2175906 RepID=A0A8H6KXW0_9PEZI|nr:putative class IV aminotransferase [Colletotrichum plurivorum]